MIQLSSKNIQPASIAHLASVQQEINKELTYEAQVNKAKTKWANKTGSNNAKAAFNNIRDVLKDMSSGAQICVYCEHNEATDIEHIYPKRLYPEKTFMWENYVFVCGKCNTHHKGEYFKIFAPLGSVTIQDITPRYKVYTQPINDDAVFINQRTEDPMELLELDILNGLFIFREIFTLGTREYVKAKYTKNLLGLNDRADLVRQRKAAHSWYLSELKKYVTFRNSTEFNTLIIAAAGLYSIDESSEFVVEKNRILDLVKKEILSHSHPTVWKELIRQRAQLPQTNLLFDQAVEILTW